MLDVKHKSSYIKGMNKLPLAKRVQILSLLCEGSSMRSISRVCDVSINTVAKMLVDAARRSRSPGLPGRRREASGGHVVRGYTLNTVFRSVGQPTVTYVSRDHLNLENSVR